MSDTYEIRVKGHLDQRWRRAFDGMRLELLENGQTRLCGAVVDQAALHNLLTRIRDLGRTLLLVQRQDENSSTINHEPITGGG